jgi:hypothetical protein
MCIVCRHAFATRRIVLTFSKFEEKRGILYILNGNFVAFTIYFTNLKLILERSKKYEVETKSKEGQTMQWLKRKEQTRLYKILHKIQIFKIVIPFVLYFKNCKR